jgi:hypothetical protein
VKRKKDTHRVRGKFMSMKRSKELVLHASSKERNNQKKISVSYEGVRKVVDGE